MEGAGLGGLGDESPPVGSRGKAPVEGLGDEVSQRHCQRSSPAGRVN